MGRFILLGSVMLAVSTGCSEVGGSSADWRADYKTAVPSASGAQQLPNEKIPVWLKSTHGYIGIGPSNGLGPGFGE